MADAQKKADRADVESAIMDAMGDVRVLDIVLSEAGESERQGGINGTRDMMLVPEDVFLAWQRMCNHMADSVREVERVFYEAGR